MATTVHLSAQLLERVDAHARSRRVSRNRVVAEALEEKLARAEEWSPGFLAELARWQATPAIDRTVRRMVSAIAAARTSTGPPRL